MSFNADEYNKLIFRKIANAANAQKKTDKTLAFDMSEIGMDFGKTTIYEILSYDKKLKKRKKKPGHRVSLMLIVGLCKVLGLEMTDVLPIIEKDGTVRENPGPVGENRSKTSNQPVAQNGPPQEQIHQPVVNNVLFQEQINQPEAQRCQPKETIDPPGSINLIRNPTHAEFHCYLDQTFDIFFHSTVTDQDELITGTMSISAKDDYCEVKITICNNSYNKNAFHKEYIGKMAISLELQACYCYVESIKTPKSKDRGELNSIVFHHKKLDNQTFHVSLAVVTTVSAGVYNLPTCHRMIICQQQKIKPQKQKRFILSLLRMNESQIIISENEFNNLADQQEISDVIDIIKSRNYSLELFYKLPESDIINIAGTKSGINYKKCVDALSLLRIKSIAHYYNKIEESDNKILFKYLFS